MAIKDRCEVVVDGIQIALDPHWVVLQVDVINSLTPSHIRPLLRTLCGRRPIVYALRFGLFFLCP
jgi:hypothetical protein